MHACQTPLRLGRKVLLNSVALLIVAGIGTAEPPSPSRRSNRDLGTWKWSVNRNLVMTLRLRREGDKLTGVLIGNDGPEKEIEDGTYDDGKISVPGDQCGRQGKCHCRVRRDFSRDCHQRRDESLLWGQTDYPARVYAVASEAIQRAKEGVDERAAGSATRLSGLRAAAVFIEFPLTRFIIGAAIHESAKERFEVRCQHGGEIVLGIDVDLGL
jgi:hypothetical protein